MPHQRGDGAPAPTNTVNVWLTERQAAEHVGYSCEHLRRLRRDGGGPLYVQRAPRGKVRYRRADLDAWLGAKA